METTPGATVLELRSRVSARAVIAGALVAITFELMLLMLGTAVRLTVFTHGELTQLVAIAFAAWFLLALMIGTFTGGWVAAGAARALRTRDGVLQAIVTWAAATLAGMSLVGGAMRGAVNGILGVSGAQALTRAAMGTWGVFAALLLPLLAAVAGGALGAARERRALGLGPVRAPRAHRVTRPEARTVTTSAPPRSFPPTTVPTT